MTAFKRIQLSICAVALAAAIVPCGAQTAAQICSATGGDLAKVMIKTKMNFVPGWNKPESQIQAKKDPQTLQLVQLSSKNVDRDRVTSDGQIIFAHGAS